LKGNCETHHKGKYGMLTQKIKLIKRANYNIVLKEQQEVFPNNKSNESAVKASCVGAPECWGPA